VTDLLALDEHVKCNHVIAHSQGAILRMRATSAKNQGEEHREYTESLFKEALIEFRQSLQAVPQSSRTIQNTADVFFQLGFPNLAFLFYKTAIDADSTDARAYYKLAHFLHSVKNYEEAERFYAKSHSLEPSPTNLIAYGSFLKEVNHEAKAGKIFQEALKLYPTDSMCHHAYANFLKHQNNISLAGHHYQLAVQYDQQNLELLYDYANFLNECGEHEKAMRYIDEYNKKIRQSSITLMDSFSVGAFGLNK